MEEVKHRYEYFLQKHFSTYQIIFYYKNHKVKTLVLPPS